MSFVALRQERVLVLPKSRPTDRPIDRLTKRRISTKERPRKPTKQCLQRLPLPSPPAPRHRRVCPSVASVTAPLESPGLPACLLPNHASLTPIRVRQRWCCWLARWRSAQATFFSATGPGKGGGGGGCYGGGDIIFTAPPCFALRGAYPAPCCGAIASCRTLLTARQ